MANMFTREKYRPLPQTLNRCIERRKIEDELWTWAAYVETIGKALCILTIVISCVVSILVSVDTETVYYNSLTETSFDFVKCMIFLCAGGISAFVTYVAFHIVALRLGALASIVENTRTNTDITVLKAINEATKSDECTEC